MIAIRSFGSPIREGGAYNRSSAIAKSTTHINPQRARHIALCTVRVPPTTGYVLAKEFMSLHPYKQAFMETHKKLKVSKLRKRSFRKMEALVAFKNWAGLNA